MADLDPKKLTPAQLNTLADKHIERFTDMINSRNRHVNVQECRAYLVIWHSIKLKLAAGHTDLSPEERREIREAVESGDYDDLLKKGASDG